MNDETDLGEMTHEEVEEEHRIACLASHYAVALETNDELYGRVDNAISDLSRDLESAFEQENPSGRWIVGSLKARWELLQIANELSLESQDLAYLHADEKNKREEL
ncbi:hypothetical protein HY450_02900 [Candidatus Pacearchaeota archaeon]|nr:hypothetical protein [Candidatus Pacearchaeota archaeon]